MTRSRWAVAGCLVAALGLGVVASAGLTRAGSGTTTRALTVDGVPILEVAPAAAGAGRPGVVIAHGFSGSAVLMRGFADTLAARGYVAVLPDFAGHGRSTARLDAADGRAATGSLQRDLTVAVRHLRALPAVDPARIALIGHSMGADAVVRFAVEHPEIRATVAVSLGGDDSLPADPALPKNLLLVVGAADFPVFRQAALAALRRADPTLSFGATTGDPTAGATRRAVSVPATEHVSVLFATRTHAETAAWLERTLPVPTPTRHRLHPRDRLAPAALLLLAFLLGFVPLAAWLLPHGGAGRELSTPPATPVRGRYAYGGLAVALTLGVLGAKVAPTSRLPLAVGDYAAGFFAVTGLVLLTAYALHRRTTPRPAPLPGSRGRHWAAAIVLPGYAAAALAVPMHLGLTHALPVGARWWLLPIVVGSVALALVGVELLAAGTRWRRPLALAAIAAALLAAGIAGLAPGYVLLVLPLLAALLAWHAGWSALLRRQSAPSWLTAAVGATVVAWPMAMTLPVTG